MTKKYYNFFTFPLLSIVCEPTQCTAALYCCILQRVWTWSYWMSAMEEKLAYEAPTGFSIATFLFIMLSLSVGGITACLTCMAEKATNGCQELLLLILLSWCCQLLLKRSLSQICSRISGQQSCCSYLVTVSWSETPTFLLDTEAYSTTELLRHRTRRSCWEKANLVTFPCICCTPIMHNNQSQKSRGNTKVHLSTWDLGQTE